MMSKHISGRIIGHIDPIEGAHSIALMIATDGVTFEVGNEVDVYLGHEERLTREEAWQELREAIERMAAAHGDRPGNVIVEWSGRDWVAVFEAGSKAYGISRDPDSPVAACNELAERGHAAHDTPDFAAMSADERRAWLRERGRLAVRDAFEGHVEALLRRHNEWGSLIAEATAADEPDALLALCEAVAGKERGEDE